jgi:predicted HD superfamily hydrolase involved in NAD metabolism
VAQDFDLRQFADAVRARLGEKGANHSVQVGETAAAVANAYGQDPQLAQLAGLLHDWDRDLSGHDLLSSAQAAGLEITDVDRAVPYLLHAKTGAEDLRKTFPELPKEVLDAVRNHTVGAVDMSDLDKIVHLADMIAPARSFPGVDELREAVGAVPLSELFARGYELSVLRLVRTRRRLHPDTVVVWNALIVGEHHG